MSVEEGLPIQPLLDAGAEWQPIPRDKKDEIFLHYLPSESIDVLSRIVSDWPSSVEAYHFAKVWSGCHDQAKFDWLKSMSQSYTLPHDHLTISPIHIIQVGKNKESPEKTTSSLAKLRATCYLSTL